jgi:hypothetical protein
MLSKRHFLMGLAAAAGAMIASQPALADGYIEPRPAVRVERIRRRPVRRVVRVHRTRRHAQPAINARAYAVEEHPWSPRAVPSTRVHPPIDNPAGDEVHDILTRGARYSAPVQYHLLPTTGGRIGGAR